MCTKQYLILFFLFYLGKYYPKVFSDRMKQGVNPMIHCKSLSVVHNAKFKHITRVTFKTHYGVAEVFNTKVFKESVQAPSRAYRIGSVA